MLIIYKAVRENGQGAFKRVGQTDESSEKLPTAIRHMESYYLFNHHTYQVLSATGDRVASFTNGQRDLF